MKEMVIDLRTSSPSEEMAEQGKMIAAWMQEGIRIAKAETVANNYNKMHGIPMRRKKNKKDKRGRLRKSIIALKRIGWDRHE